LAIILMSETVVILSGMFVILSGSFVILSNAKDLSLASRFSPS
jgi:hypothetical protein